MTKSSDLSTSGTGRICPHGLERFSYGGLMQNSAVGCLQHLLSVRKALLDCEIVRFGYPFVFPCVTYLYTSYICTHLEHAIMSHECYSRIIFLSKMYFTSEKSQPYIFWIEPSILIRSNMIHTSYDIVLTWAKRRPCTRAPINLQTFSFRLPSETRPSFLRFACGPKRRRPAHSSGLAERGVSYLSLQSVVHAVT